MSQQLPPNLPPFQNPQFPPHSQFQPVQPQQPPPPQVVYVHHEPSKGIAALLSLLIPGAGQMYRGQVAAGILWFFLVFTGYVCFIVPGLVLHIICIAAAAS